MPWTDLNIHFQVSPGVSWGSFTIGSIKKKFTPTQKSFLKNNLTPYYKIDTCDDLNDVTTYDNGPNDENTKNEELRKDDCQSLLTVRCQPNGAASRT